MTIMPNKSWSSRVYTKPFSAKRRITVGTVMNLKEKLGKYIMFFHGSGPKSESEGDFDKNASIGIAWSDDLLNWDWPGKNK